MKYQVSLYGASRSHPDLVSMRHFTMKADSRHELIARIHADYVNVLLLDFKPILSVKK